MPRSLLYQNALPLIRDFFHKEHPEIRIDVTTSQRRGSRRAIDVDMAIVFDRPNVDDKVADLLWMRCAVAPLCSPETAAAHRARRRAVLWAMSCCM